MSTNAAPAPLAFYRKRFKIENNLTGNILKAIPPDKLAYRPHERSPSTCQGDRDARAFGQSRAFPMVYQGAWA